METTYRNLIEIPERGYHYFRHYFIPHEGNNHYPLVVRPSALKAYSVALIAVKVLLTGFLYAVYPTEAQFAELTASKIFELTNTSRVENGQPSIKLSALLTKAAQAKAQDMIRVGYFDHTGPDGKKFWQWIKETGYAYTTAGENLAMDFTTAESAHRALMASASHRKNILKSNYTEMGVAVAQGSMNGRETTVLVEYFGTPSSGKRLVVTTPKTQPAPPPAQTAKPEAKPAVPAYRATHVGTSNEKLILFPGGEVSVWVDFKNSGSAVWRNDREHFLAFNVTNPAGRTSAFLHPSWKAPYRPAVLSQKTVKPGQTGRFSFTLKAPETSGIFTEDFAIVAENLTWVEGGLVSIPVTVESRQPAVAAGEEPEPPQKDVEQQYNTTTTVVAVEEAHPAIQPSDEQPTPLVVTSEPRPDWRRQVVDWSVRFFWAFLIFLTVSLALTIFVRIRVQHRPAILQTLLVLSLAAFMVLVRLHVAERIANILVT